MSIVVVAREVRMIYIYLCDVVLAGSSTAMLLSDLLQDFLLRSTLPRFILNIHNKQIISGILA